MHYLESGDLEAEWINRRLQDITVDQQQIRSILHFSLIWNLFERQCCDRNVSIPRMKKFVSKLNVKGRLEILNFEPLLYYFRQRYISEGSTNKLFEGLNFRANDRKELVEKVLMGDEKNSVEIVLALLIIVYRFRNNFFHGEKPLPTINKQIENFSCANRVLMHLMDLNKPTTAV